MLTWFRNIPIGSKVTLLFAVISLTTIGLGTFAIERMGAMDDNILDVHDNWLPSVKLLGHIAQQVERYRANVTGLLLSQDDDHARTDWERFVAVASADIDKSWAIYEPLVTPGEEQRVATSIKQQWHSMLEVVPFCRTPFRFL